MKSSLISSGDASFPSQRPGQNMMSIRWDRAGKPAARRVWSRCCRMAAIAFERLDRAPLSREGSIFAEEQLRFKPPEPVA